MKQLREKTQKRPETIASELNVALSTVRNWESGRHEPRLPISQIPQFLRVYDCTLDEAIEAAQASYQQFHGKNH